MRERIAVLLTSILWLTPAYSAQEANPVSPELGADMALAAPELTHQQAKLRDRMDRVPLDSWIEAKLRDGQVVTGRLEDTYALGFTLLVGAPDKLQNQTINYIELKSFKRLGRIQPKTPTEQALLIPTGSLVTVQLKNRERLQVWLGEVSNDGIMTQTGDADSGQWRKIPFADLQTISGPGENRVVTALKILAYVSLYVFIASAQSSGGSRHEHSRDRGRSSGKGSGTAHAGKRGH